MASRDDLPELVRDSELQTTIRRDVTIHTKPRGRRAAPRKETWAHEKIIGNGGYGIVWLQRKVAEGSKGPAEFRAVKQIQMSGMRGRRHYVRELEALAKFSQDKYSDFFVKSHGWYESTESLYIAMEYCEHGDLKRYLNTNGTLTEDHAQDIAAQVLGALSLMHEADFAHRDVKPQNILVKSMPPKEWWVKLCDLGLSKRTEDISATTKVHGTPGFMPPEMEGIDCDPKAVDPFCADMWCFGETVYQALTGRATFENTRERLEYYLGGAEFPDEPLEGVGVSVMAVDFVKGLMKPRPGQRLTAKTAFQHPWMQAERAPGSPGSGQGQDPSSPVPQVAAPYMLGGEQLTQPSGSWTATGPQGMPLKPGAPRMLSSEQLTQPSGSWTATGPYQPVPIPAPTPDVPRKSYPAPAKPPANWTPPIVRSSIGPYPVVAPKPVPRNGSPTQPAAGRGRGKPIVIKSPDGSAVTLPPGGPLRASNPDLASWVRPRSPSAPSSDPFRFSAGPSLADRYPSPASDAPPMSSAPKPKPSREFVPSPLPRAPYVAYPHYPGAPGYRPNPYESYYYAGYAQGLGVPTPAGANGNPYGGYGAYQSPYMSPHPYDIYLQQRGLYNNTVPASEPKRDVDSSERKPDAQASEAGPQDGPAETPKSNPPSRFGQISSYDPHIEPEHDPPDTAEIQFRFLHAPGRRRFRKRDQVRRVYEWLKSEMRWANRAAGRYDMGPEFMLRRMPQGQDLIDDLDRTIEEAGLEGATVMVDFVYASAMKDSAPRPNASGEQAGEASPQVERMTQLMKLSTWRGPGTGNVMDAAPEAGSLTDYPALQPPPSPSGSGRTETKPPARRNPPAPETKQPPQASEREHPQANNPDKFPSFDKEKDILKSFKDFAANQRANAEKVRVAKAREAKQAKLTDLLKFGSTFKLETPMPADIAWIVAKDPEKRRRIQDIALENARAAAEKKAAAAAAGKGLNGSREMGTDAAVEDVGEAAERETADATAGEALDESGQAEDVGEKRLKRMGLVMATGDTETEIETPDAVEAVAPETSAPAVAAKTKPASPEPNGSASGKVGKKKRRSRKAKAGPPWVRGDI